MKPSSTGGPADRAGREPQTGEAIRNATDRGEVGDKVNFPDPATAPLGTDAEAAGAPAAEPGAASRQQAPEDVPRPNDTNNRSSAPVLILVGFVVIFALVLWVVL